MKTMPVLPCICCRSDAPLLSEPEAEELAARFKALGDPTRVAIVNRLSAAEEVCVCDLNAAFALSQPTISHHLRILREAGLVNVTRRGTWAYYRLVPEAVGALRAALEASAPTAEPPGASVQTDDR
jgi:ArsR family transcriptional regulator, arsenate/arsenite/antimonite-responsive transcriptional repressor